MQHMMMMSKVFLLISLVQSASAWSVSGGQSSTPSTTTKEATTTSTTPLPTRRSFLGALATTSSLVSFPNLARSATDEVNSGGDELIDVYFGCGCFWHVQHEFVEAERKILGRSDEEITARAGYAGGKAGSLDGKVCYHNAANIADYGKLGHAEVVSLRIPANKFYDFAVEYCKLFNKDGFRPDQFGDRGTEYRNLVGIPGGKSSPLAELLVKASVSSGDKLDFAVGKGDDKDLPKVSFIMDTKDYPSFVAEQYHQFHDGFNFGENYPNSYNSLAATFAKKGEDFGQCPNGMLGVGLAGL
jgi:peptide methionine sulfoxide reductase MsrA